MVDKDFSYFLLIGRRPRDQPAMRGQLGADTGQLAAVAVSSM
jgi:hypothetical protein